MRPIKSSVELVVFTIASYLAKIEEGLHNETKINGTIRI